MKRQHLTGQKFGNLTILEEVASFVLCQCTCGTIVRRTRYSVTGGRSTSCGCTRIKTRHGHARKKAQSKEYICWLNMRHRCLNPKDKEYTSYGGRGITICTRWLDSFDAFIADMGLAPTPKHSLDRVNNEEGYSPKNCRWATIDKQANNRSLNQYVEFDGMTKTYSQWDQYFGFNPGTIRYRIKLGWPIEKVMTMPLRGHKNG